MLVATVTDHFDNVANEIHERRDGTFSITMVDVDSGNRLPTIHTRGTVLAALQYAREYMPDAEVIITAAALCTYPELAPVSAARCRSCGAAAHRSPAVEMWTIEALAAYCPGCMHDRNAELAALLLADDN